MRIVFTAPAARSLDVVLSHIAEQSPSGAKRVQTRLRVMLALLEEHPSMRAITRREGVRRLVASPYPYLIYYRVRDDAVVILAVRHAARKPL